MTSRRTSKTDTDEGHDLMTSYRDRNKRPMLPGLREAIRMLKARKGPATEDDRPRRPERPPRVLSGQLDLDGNEYRPKG
jgi:hypothetical protein